MMHITRFLAVMGGVMTSAVALSASAAEHHDVVDVSIRHQVIENFGASDCWTMQEVGTWSDENRNKAADLLFSREKGIGLSLWRFNIGAGKEPGQQNIRDPLRSAECFEVSPGKYDWSRQAGQQWFLTAAKDRGVDQFLAFLNSPPARMTRNGLTNLGDDKKSSTNLKPGMQDEYAKFITDVLLHFRESGTDFRYVSPVNEPEIAWEGTTQEGNRVDNMTIRRIVRSLHKELAARRMKSEILAAEGSMLMDSVRPATLPSQYWSAMYGDYVDELAGDETVAPLLSNRICYHMYGTAEGENMLRATRRMGEKMAEYPGWKSWMSEVCILKHRRDLGMTSAIELAQMIHAALTLANSSAFHWWLALSTYDYKDGLLYSDWKKRGDPESVLESKMLWAMGNYSRYIRPGFMRVELTGEAHTLSGLLGSAYMNPESGQVVIVYINAGGEPENVQLTMKGNEKPIKSTKGWLTSDEQSLGAMDGIEAGKPVSIPAKSVVTLVIER